MKSIRPTSLVLLASALSLLVACTSDPAPESEGPTGAATPPPTPTSPPAPGADASHPVDGGPGKDSGVDAEKPPTCTDGIKNGTETDVDCGGSCAPRCAVNKGCSVGADCVTATCIQKICRAATSTDGVKNGTETDVDCGGPDAPPCKPGEDCLAGNDCESKICMANTCTTPSSTDGVKNGTETDVDCGGPDPLTPRCAPPRSCVAGGDCDSGVCTGNACQAPSPTDGVRNGTETDVDCGGPDVAIPRCPATKACVVPEDCSSLICVGNVCRAPSPTDGVKNGTETDVDCGGPDPLTPRCAPALSCVTAIDCDSLACVGNVCQEPSPTDGVKNGTETDVDCGGPDPLTPRCDIPELCVDPTDCRGGVCAGNRCGAPRSCNGGGRGKDNCGPGADESCCTSLRVPDLGDLPPANTRDAEGRYRYNRTGSAALPAWVSPFYLDKFELTQGRMRTFLTTYNGNLYGALNLPEGAGEHPAIPGSGWRSTFNRRLPRTMNEVRDRFTVACGEGGDNANGGAATWTTTAGANDDKPITCVDWYTLLAFCIWDGGSLPTEAEWGFAGEGGNLQRTYAWGPVPSATDADWSANPSLAPATHAFCTDGGTPAFASCFSWGTPYRLPGDGAAHISPAGRRQDIARWGHHDMTGNLIEWMLDYQRTPGTCVDCANVDWPDPPVAPGSYPSSWATVGAPELTGTAHTQDGPRLMRGGSWERHGLSTRTSYPNYPLYRSYYASGARCWRRN